MRGLPIKRLDRYIFRQLGFALVAATGALVALIWLTQSLRFVELVVNRGLSLLVFLKLTGLLIPNFVAVILPITTFVVVQFVYQRLSGDRELTVMRSAGMSPWALSRPAAALTGIAVLTCFLLNIWLVPYSYSAFREYQFEISEPPRRLPAAGRRIHGNFRRPYRLRPLPRHGRPAAWHFGGR